MPSNILYRNDDMLESNNEIYGTNKVRYVPWINRIVGSEKNYSNGKLGEMTIKSIGYDLTQKFPESKLAQLIKATSTEFAQATANPREFSYTKSVLGVEFIISNLKGADMSNVEAGILNELMKQYDVDGYSGGFGNKGVNNNPVLVETASAAISTIDTLMDAISKGRKTMKDKLGITDDDFSDVLMGYSSGIADVYNKRTGDTTGRKMVKDTFPDIEMGEIPKFITDSVGADKQYLEFYYKPMLKMHHGAAPSKYNTEEGAHGLSASSLFVYETIGVEGEATGAIVRVPVTIA